MAFNHLIESNWITRELVSGGAGLGGIKLQSTRMWGCWIKEGS